MPLWRMGAADVILDHSEQSLVADNAFRLSSLNAVLEQLKTLNCDALSFASTTLGAPTCIHGRGELVGPQKL